MPETEPQQPDAPDTPAVEPEAPEQPEPAPAAEVPEGAAEEPPQEAPEEPFDAARAKAKIAKANSEAAGLRKRLKDAEPLLAELKRLKDADKTEAERLADQLAEANARVAAAQARAVRASVIAKANAFADPEDALGALDLTTYITDVGDVDEDAIAADLASLLERKPHWAGKAQPPEGPRRPAPDRTQASGANKPTPTDPADEFAGWLKQRLVK